MEADHALKRKAAETLETSLLSKRKQPDTESGIDESLHGSTFVECIEAGDPKVLEDLLRDSKENPNGLYTVSWWSAKLTALCIACRRNHPGVVAKLLEYGAKVNQQAPEGITPAFIATRYHNIEIMDILKSHGADFNIPCNDGFTPLAWAVRSEQVDSVKKLLDYGANARVTDPHYKPLLSVAVQNDSLETVKLLVEKGKVDVNWAPHSPDLPVCRAISQKNSAIMKYLIENGAKVNAQDEEKGRTMLYLMCRNMEVETVRLLLQDGFGFGEKADPNVLTRRGESCLYIASLFNCSEIVKLLLDHGARINNAQTKNRITALHVACYNGSLEIVKLLLTGSRVGSEKANPNILSKEGVSALDNALDKENLEIIKQLLKHGAQPNARKDQMKNLLYQAREKEDLELMNLIPLVEVR